jgi:hypothetical protein
MDGNARLSRQRIGFIFATLVKTLVSKIEPTTYDRIRRYTTIFKFELLQKIRLTIRFEGIEILSLTIDYFISVNK